MKDKQTYICIYSLQYGFEKRYINALNNKYLIEAKEAEVSDHIERTHSGPRGDLPSNLKTNLNDFQRVGENDLRATSLKRTRPSFY